MKKRYLVFGILAVPALLVAQFLPGIPQVVFDPTSDAHIIQNVQQAIRLYNQAQATYNQIAANAVWATNKRAWLGMATQVMNSRTTSRFGETAAWNPAITQASSVPAAWTQATFAMNPAPFYSSFPVGQSSMSANIASVEIADGMSQAAMTSIANSRMNQPMNDEALTNLEQYAQDTTRGANSAVEQLNVIASGNVLLNRQQENQNALLTTIAEQQILANKVSRDTISDAINVQSVRDTYVANEAAEWGGSAATISNYLQ